MRESGAREGLHDGTCVPHLTYASVTITIVSNRTQREFRGKHGLPLRSSLTSGTSVGAAVVVEGTGCMLEVIVDGG